MARAARPTDVASPHSYSRVGRYRIGLLASPYSTPPRQEAPHWPPRVLATTALAAAAISMIGDAYLHATRRR